MTPVAAVILPSESVTLHRGEPVTTSCRVAETFEKEHKDVLRAIREIEPELPTEWNQRNFAPISFTDAMNRQQPAYRLTRDGFTLLAMGFTGPRALAFKLAYIQEFNRLQLAASMPDSNTLEGMVMRQVKRLSPLDMAAVAVILNPDEQEEFTRRAVEILTGRTFGASPAPAAIPPKAPTTSSDFVAIVSGTIRARLTAAGVDPERDPAWIRSDLLTAWLNGVLRRDAYEGHLMHRVREAARAGLLPQVDTKVKRWPHHGTPRVSGVMWNWGKATRGRPVYVIGQ